MEQSKLDGWIAIKDNSLVMQVLQSYADVDKKKILDASVKPKIILDIIDTCKLPQTSSYRKINSLIQNGFLVPHSHVSVKHGKVVTKYVSLFENLEISIVKNTISIRAKIGEDSRNAILRNMREKIVELKYSNSRNQKSLSKMLYGNLRDESSESVIQYLLKERIIKI